MKYKHLRMAALLLTAALALGAVPAALAVSEAPELPSSFVLNTRAGEIHTFSPADFTARLSGEAPLDGILITALPDAAVGTLLYGSRELLAGEAIAVESLAALKFVPAAGDVTSASFEFLPVYAQGVGLSGVTVSLQPAAAVDQPPTAQPAAGRTYRNVAVELRLTGSDPEGGALTFALTEKPARGEAALDPATGVLTYTPYHDKSGEDTFSFTVTDPAGNVSPPAPVTVTIGKSAPAPTYADLETNSAHYAALRLREEGIFTGEQIGEESFFHPEREMTRGEFLSMAVRALTDQEVTPVLKTGFADDAQTASWVRPYASAALKAGLIRGSGGSDGALYLNSASVITRAEAAVILDKALSLDDAAVSTTVFAGEAAASWAVQPVANLQAEGLLPAETGPLSQGLTRAEAAKLLAAAMDQQQEEAPKKWFFGLF